MALSDIRQELEVIRLKHGGSLSPEAVVAFAKNPKTALHGQFEWGNTEAARLWRLHQARNIINVQVTVIDTPKGSISVRAYQSLPSSRGAEGGYRATVDVISHVKLRKEMLGHALAELISFRSRYAVLRELAKVHRAIDAVARRKAK